MLLFSGERSRSYIEIRCEYEGVYVGVMKLGSN
jgi:hypothetical protein